MNFFKNIFIFALFAVHPIMASERYQIVDMGVLKHPSSEASSINNLGQICGSYKDNGKSYLFIYDSKEKKNNYTEVKNTTRPIINDKSEIYGSYSKLKNEGVFEFDQESIYRWENPLSYFTYFNFTDLGYPDSQSQKYFEEKKRIVLWDVNDHRQTIVMNSVSIDNKWKVDNFKYKVWIHDNGNMQEITNPQFEAAIKINNNSQVMGCFFEEPPSKLNRKIPRISLYDLKTGKITVLQFTDAAFGNDLNDKDQIAGVYYDSAKSKIQGFLTDNANSDILPIDNFCPIALNNNSVIVGRFQDGEKKNKPAIWDNGCLNDLMEVVDLVDDMGNIWESLDALIDLNDEGYIIGNGTIHGQPHGFLLVPANHLH